MRENLGIALYAFLFMILPLLLAFCSNEPDQRQEWQDCGGTQHEVCWEGHGSKQCEYEYYKECVNAR